MKTLRKYGSPPYKIAVVHGGPGARGEMRTVAQHLSSENGILEPLQTSVSVKGQINELKTQLLSVDNCSFILIGFSWGAWLSLLTAVYHPSMLKKVIIIGCGPFELKYAQEINEKRLARLNSSDKAEFKSILANLNDSNRKHQDLELKKLKKLTDKTDQFNPLRIKTETIDLDINAFQNVWKEAVILRKTGKFIELMQRITCPVVAIHGAYDPHPIEGVKAPLSRILSDLRFIELKNCGHKPWVEKEAKNEFYRILQSEIQ